MTNTLFIGKVYDHFDELPSTNDRAAELIAKSKPPEGTVVRADTQTAGRGQFGSRWISAPGQNLLISVVLYPQWLPVKDQFYLSMVSALALHDAVNHPDATIKWPNDLYIGRKKSAGILIQNTISGASLQSAVVGIGLNVNQSEFDAGLPNPTSLACSFGHTFDLDAIMQRLFECLEHRYLQLKSGKRAEIKQTYESLLFCLHERARFAKNDRNTVFEGIIRGVDDAGRLCVEVAGTGITPFDLKEIRMLL